MRFAWKETIQDPKLCPVILLVNIFHIFYAVQNDGAGRANWLTFVLANASMLANIIS